MEQNKILFITGASSETASQLIRRVEKKYDVILAHYCNNIQPINELKQEIGEKLIPVQADFSNLEDVQRMISEIKELGYNPDHIVHLPAEKPINAKFYKTETKEYIQAMNIAVFAFVEIAKAFIRPMIKKKYGKIVIMLTAYTLDLPPKYQTVYVTAKYSLLGLMKSLSVEYMEKGITVNAISPQMMETKFLSEVPELIVQQNAAASPLKRNLKVEDIVCGFEYLLSDGADMVTGQNIGITGGK